MTSGFEKLLPAEFRSGNSIPVERATITRQRMLEIIEDTLNASRVNFITTSCYEDVEVAVLPKEKAESYSYEQLKEVVQAATIKTVETLIEKIDNGQRAMQGNIKSASAQREFDIVSPYFDAMRGIAKSILPNSSPPCSASNSPASTHKECAED